MVAASMPLQLVDHQIQRPLVALLLEDVELMFVQEFEISVDLVLLLVFVPVQLPEV